MSGNDDGPKFAPCYQLERNQVQTFNGTPCGKSSEGGKFMQCCQKGDTCLPDHFCYFSHTLPGASGYYVALCTDPERKDPACTDRCGSLGVQDAVFDPKTNLWACCDIKNKVRQCQNPSNETFQADSPSALFSAATASATTSLTLTPTAAVTPTDAAASATDTAAASPGLSAGAAAGVGIGAGVGGILVIAAIAFLIVRWLRRRRAAQRDGATVRPELGSVPPDEPTPMYPGRGGAAAASDPKKDDKKYQSPPVIGSPQPGPGAPLLGHSKSRRELDSAPVGRDELDGEANRLSELSGGPQQPANRPTVELEGSEVGR